MVAAQRIFAGVRRPGSRPDPSPNPKQACRQQDRPDSVRTSVGTGDCRSAPCQQESRPPPSSLDHCPRTNGGQGLAVIDTPRTGPAEKGEGFIMGVKHHLPRLARIGPNKRHPAVAEANMRHLDRRGRAIDQDNFPAPVELIRLTGIKAQRNISISGCGPRRLRPTGRIAPYRIIAAVVSLVAQFFIYPDKRQAFAPNAEYCRPAYHPIENARDRSSDAAGWNGHS